MTEGELEMMIGKVAHAFSLTNRAVAEMMREFWKQCKGDSKGTARATDFDPPFEERVHMEPVIGTERAVVHLSEIAEYPDPKALLDAAKSVPPVIDVAELAPQVIPAPTADKLTALRLQARYKWLTVKARKVKENRSEVDEGTVAAIRECKAQAAALNVRLELAADDPTGGKSPAEELLGHAVAERNKAVTEQNKRETEKVAGKQTVKSTQKV